MLEKLPIEIIKGIISHIIFWDDIVSLRNTHARLNNVIIKNKNILNGTILHEGNGKLTKQITDHIDKGEDIEALGILRENDQILFLESVKKIYNQIFCRDHHLFQDCDDNIDVHHTFHFLMRDSYHSGNLDISNNNFVIRDACFHGRLGIVRILLNNLCIDPSTDNNYAIRYASQNGHSEVVKILLNDSRVDPSADDNYAIIHASTNGHSEVVKLLLNSSRVDPSAQYNIAIVRASFWGHLEVIKLLLNDKRVDPSAQNNSAIRYAFEYGHLEVVKLLLNVSHVDLSADIVRRAIEKGHSEIVELLNHTTHDILCAQANYAVRIARDIGYLIAAVFHF